MGGGRGGEVDIIKMCYIQTMLHDECNHVCKHVLLKIFFKKISFNKIMKKSSRAILWVSQGQSPGRTHST